MSSISIQIGHGDNPVASNPSDKVVTTTIKEDEDNVALKDNQDDLISVKDESVDNTWAETTKGEKKGMFSPNKCLVALALLALFGTALTAGKAVGNSKAFNLNTAEFRKRALASGSSASGSSRSRGRPSRSNGSAKARKL